MPVSTYSSTYSPAAAASTYRSGSLLASNASTVTSSHKYLDNYRSFPSASSASSASIASTGSASSNYSSSSSASSSSSLSASNYASLTSGSRSLTRPTLRTFGTQSSVGSTPRSSISSYTSLQSSPSSSSTYNYSSSPLAALNSSSNVTLTGYQRRSSFVNDLDTKPYSSTSHSPSSSSTSSSSSSSATLKQQIPNYLAGLNNLGNTCYMNSVLQALYSTQLFKKFVTRNPKGSLLSALGKLYEDMSEPENTVVYPSAFRNQFIKFQPKFRGYDQQDAQEFLRYLINGIHEEVNQAKYSTRPKHFKSPRSSSEAWEQYKYIDDSPLIDLVAGQLGSTIRCTVCNHSSTCYDPFWDLSLPLPNNLRECDVLRCLDEFTALEHMDAGELVTCERCNRQRRCTKELSIVKMPTVLILHLKRFSNEGYKLSYPRITPNERLTIAGRQFQLYSMVCHHGSSSRSGHYTAYSCHNNKWYHFNDEKITEETNFKPSNCDDAYILFYIDKERDRPSYTSRL